MPCRHLSEARDLAEGFDGTWLTAGSRVQLGILGVVRGQLDEAKGLLDEALSLSLASRSTPFVALTLAAYARLAVRRRRPGAGGAAGRRGRRACVSEAACRRGRCSGAGEAELVAQIRQALDAQRFDQAFSAGTRLSQREAVAAVRDRSGTGTGAHAS